MSLMATVASCGWPSREPVEQPAAMPGPSPFVYPLDLWDSRIEGEALLMVHVTEHGAVDSAYVVGSSGFQAFDSAAVRGAHQLRFAPGRRGRRRIAMWTKLPVRFAIDTTRATGQAAPVTGAR